MSHIMVWRGELPEDGLRGFWHHGILCDDKKVIHYSGMEGMKTLRNAQIKRTEMIEFLGKKDEGNRTIHSVKYEEEKYDRGEVIKRAESKIGEKGYNLLSHNCENFARWCMIGDSKSYQVEGAWIGLGGGLATVVVGGGLLGAALTGLVVQRVWDSSRNKSNTRQPFNVDRGEHMTCSRANTSNSGFETDEE